MIIKFFIRQWCFAIRFGSPPMFYCSKRDVPDRVKAILLATQSKLCIRDVLDKKLIAH